ncbi:MAG: 4Fe-4S dicluster domain-containing protein [Desulfobacterales bacterium]|nr:4Fe-4S dicluster domain-containing protein [Desulfobacterales bacterium]
MIGEFLAFAEGPLLRIVFILFATGLLLRTIFFVVSILRRRRFLKRRPIIDARPFLIVRLLLPFHNAFLKKPLYSLLRYGFHFSLFVVPIWLAGHVSLWEESRFEWYWTPLPDNWADEMTLFVLAACSYFLVRRIILGINRKNASIKDVLFIVLTGLPFLTGYFYTHGSLDHIAFFETYMWYFHVLSAEAMLLMIAILFLRTRLSADRCTGCAACELNCPTGTLEKADSHQQRVFSYSHYQCIACGTCVGVCPEDAAELRHEINFSHLYRIFSKRPIRSVELSTCESCGALIAPQPQMQKLLAVAAANEIESEMLNCCSRCKKIAAQQSHLFPQSWKMPAKGKVEDSPPV